MAAVAVVVWDPRALVRLSRLGGGAINVVAVVHPLLIESSPVLDGELVRRVWRVTPHCVLDLSRRRSDERRMSDETKVVRERRMSDK